MMKNKGLVLLLLLIVAAVAATVLFAGGNEKSMSNSASSSVVSSPPGSSALPADGQIKADGTRYIVTYNDEEVATISVTGDGKRQHQGSVVGLNGWQVDGVVRGFTDVWTLSNGQQILKLNDTFIDPDHDRIWVSGSQTTPAESGGCDFGQRLVDPFGCQGK